MADPKKWPMSKRPKSMGGTGGGGGGGGIGSAAIFADEVLKIHQKLDKENNYGGLVPIHELRAAMGDQVTREEFSKWMLDAQSKNLLQFTGGEVRGATQSQREDSITIPGGGLRFYATIEDKGKSRISGMTDRTPKKFGAKADRWPTEKIKSPSSFASALIETKTRLDREYNLGGLVPIHRARAKLGSRVSDSQFNQWLGNAVENGIVGLGRGGTGDRKNEYSVNGLTRYYLTD